MPAARAESQHGDHPAASAATPDSRPPLLDGLGVHHHAVTTASPEAQRYFDHGLRLVYAFNHDEAIRAFREAARLDPDCAMAWWGIAVAAGPNYNMVIDDPRDLMAREAIEKAVAVAPKASPTEREYVAA